jgi:hypothetical protein
MKRTAGMCVLLLGLSGCVTMEGQTGASDADMHLGKAPTVPGVQGPWGQPVQMAAPYSTSPPPSAREARAMLSESLPLDLVQTSYPTPQAALPASPSQIEQVGGACPPGMIAPPGVPFAPGVPGMGGAGGAGFAALAGGQASYFPTHRTSVRFVAPTGMKVSWYTGQADGKPGFSATQIEVPGRYNFAQAAIYRLKLTDIPGRPGVELYPTLEVVPSNARTDPFLAHSSVPVTFTEEDFEQVAAGNYVVKVIYLPSPQFQDLATTGPDEVVSSRLEPGVDPIAEAHRRGSILLVVRLGNIDLEAPNTPAMDAPSPNQPKGPCAPPPGPAGAGVGPGLPGAGALAGPPGPMVPYDAVGSGRPLMLSPNMPPLIMGPQGLMMLGPPAAKAQGVPGPVHPVVPPGSALPPTVPGPAPVPPPPGTPQASAGGASVRPGYLPEIAQVSYQEAQAAAAAQQPDQDPAKDPATAPPAEKKPKMRRWWFNGPSEDSSQGPK